MVKVITYGTYDHLHYGHIRLLERAKALGDYLIVGVTADDFDKSRNKINVEQTLVERIEGVRSTGLADEIIVEEYEGQKIDDIKRLKIDIFTVGSDWRGTFDYLNEYCNVVYLERTEGISSSELRAKENFLRIGMAGDADKIEFSKYYHECKAVNGAIVTGIFSDLPSISSAFNTDEGTGYEGEVYTDYGSLLDAVNAVYIASYPQNRASLVRQALESGKHVICKSPISLKYEECRDLYRIAQKNNLVLMEAIKTAYSTAYRRMLLLAKSGKIGKILSVEATCTSLADNDENSDKAWNSIDMWGPTALLPVFQLFGCDYDKVEFISYKDCNTDTIDRFTQINIVYKKSVATIKVGKGIKSEGELIISGTKGYIYIPAPWWKTEYFEIRYENQNNNKRYFYQLDGEGISLEMATFVRSINTEGNVSCIDQEVTEGISKIMELYYNDQNTIWLE